MFNALTAFFCMALFGVFVKAASLAGGSSLTINFTVYLGATLLTLPYMIKQGKEFFKTEYFLYHFLRAAFGVLASFLYLFSLRYIPLVNATLLFNTAPIFIPILGLFILNEKVSPKCWLAVFLGLIGIAIIIHPNKNILSNPADLIGLASGFSLAVAYVYIKKLTPTDPPARILFYFFTLATLLQLPFLANCAAMPAEQSFLWAILGCVVFALAQMYLVKAYEVSSAAQVGIFQYSTVVFVGLIDWVVWGAVPPLLDIAGIALVAIAGTMAIRSGHPTILKNSPQGD